MSVYLKGAIVAVLAALAMFAWYRSNESKLPANQSPEMFSIVSKMENEGVPDFSLKRLDGSELKLSQYKGKVIVLNFWASWCNPCVEEFPALVKLAERAKGDVIVVAVSADEQRKDIEPFLKLFGLPKPGFEIVWDQDKKVSQMYGVGKIPESYVIRTDFKLARKIIGIEDWASDEALAFFKMIERGAK